MLAGSRGLRPLAPAPPRVATLVAPTWPAVVAFEGPDMTIPLSRPVASGRATRAGDDRGNIPPPPVAVTGGLAAVPRQAPVQLMPPSKSRTMAAPARNDRSA